jgi:ribosome-associated protein
MDDMLSQIELSKALGVLLEEHRGLDVAALDLRGLNAWTDFFVIATVTSNTHQQGLERHIKDFCHEKGIDILRVSPQTRQRRSAERLILDDEWRLIDLGAIVIHLMTEKARSFYELERLWEAADLIYKSSSSRSSSSSSSKSSSSSS